MICDYWPTIPLQTSYGASFDEFLSQISNESNRRNINENFQPPEIFLEREVATDPILPITTIQRTSNAQLASVKELTESTRRARVTVTANQLKFLFEKFREVSVTGEKFTDTEISMKYFNGNRLYNNERIPHRDPNFFGLYRKFFTSQISKYPATVPLKIIVTTPFENSEVKEILDPSKGPYFIEVVMSPKEATTRFEIKLLLEKYRELKDQNRYEGPELFQQTYFNGLYKTEDQAYAIKKRPLEFCTRFINLLKDCPATAPLKITISAPTLVKRPIVNRDVTVEEIPNFNRPPYFVEVKILKKTHTANTTTTSQPIQSKKRKRSAQK